MNVYVRVGVAAISLSAMAACKKSDTGAVGEAGDEARKAKTTEAIDTLDRLYKGAAIYFTTPHVAAATGDAIACQFPASTDWTPSGNPCEQPDKRFKVDPDAWSAPSWAAMGFAMNDAHFYRYKLESSGTLASATITLFASADLDCDGKWSTFKRVVTADPASRGNECGLGEGRPLDIQDELE